MRTCFDSDAAVLAELAHQALVLSRVLTAADGAAVPPPKRSFARTIAAKQCGYLFTAIRGFCTRASWADLEPVKPILLETLRSLLDEQTGEFRGETSTVSRGLRRLRRACYALHQGLADTLISTRPQIKVQVGRVWSSMPDIEVPVALQPPPMKVKVIDVNAERERARKTKTYPAKIAGEAVLMQYAVDTGLDRALSGALEDACTSKLLIGNPMNSVLLRIKASAQLFDLWREQDSIIVQGLLNENCRIYDLRTNIWCCKNVMGSKGPAYISSQARWGGLSGQAGLQEEDSLPNVATVTASGPRGEDAIYGVKPALLLADNTQLYALRQSLGDLFPMKSTTITHETRRHECKVYTCYCGEMLLHGRFTSMDALHSIDLREDHFIRGPSSEEALAIHCQHVVQSFKKIHEKTLHLAAGLMLGSHMWSASDIIQNDRQAVVEAIRALKSGRTLVATIHALLKPTGGGGSGSTPRYVEIRKEFHLVHFAAGPASPAKANAQGVPPPSVQAWPPRTTQMFDAIFLSPAHVQACVEAEVTTGDPLQGWRAKKYANLLTEHVRDSHRGGLLLPACRALLLRSFLIASADVTASAQDEAAALYLLPSVGRLLLSSANRLHELGSLGKAIHGVLALSHSGEEQKVKVDNKALAAMFHAFRAPTAAAFASDAACNFECLRSTVQNGFYDVSLDLRQQGVLGEDAIKVLETVVDYVELVEASVAHQVVSAADPRLRRELKHCAHKSATHVDGSILR